MKKQNSGLTLIEVLIYTFLLTIVLGLITNFFYQVINFKVNNQIESDLFQNSLFAINKITQDIKEAESVNSPIDENFVDTLILETQSGQITYNVNNGILQRNGSDLTDDKVEIDLSSFEKGFRKIGNSIQIKVGFTAKLKPFGQNPKKNDYQTTVSLF